MKLLLTSTLEHFSHKLPLVFGEALKNMNVLCIPTAAYAEEGYEGWLDPELSAVKPHVSSFVIFDIKNKAHNDLTEALDNTDLVYVTGGNTYCLLEEMKKIDFQKALNIFLEAGGVYMGSSAGSIVMCPDIDFIGDLDDSTKASLSSTAALNLVNFSIMPHINQPKFHDKFKATLDGLNKGRQIIGLRDDQALLIEDDYIQIY